MSMFDLCGQSVRAQVKIVSMAHRAQKCFRRCVTKAVFDRKWRMTVDLVLCIVVLIDTDLGVIMCWERHSDLAIDALGIPQAIGWRYIGPTKHFFNFIKAINSMHTFQCKFFFEWKLPSAHDGYSTIHEYAKKTNEDEPYTILPLGDVPGWIRPLDFVQVCIWCSEIQRGIDRRWTADYFREMVAGRWEPLHFPRLRHVPWHVKGYMGIFTYPIMYPLFLIMYCHLPTWNIKICPTAFVGIVGYKFSSSTLHAVYNQAYCRPWRDTKVPANWRHLLPEPKQTHWDPVWAFQQRLGQQGHCQWL